VTQGRVFHLIKSLGRGGAETLLVQTQASPECRYEYSYGYFLPWKNALAEELVEGGSDVRCFRSRGNLTMLAQVPAIALALRASGADILHCHLPLAGVVGRLAARIVGIPVIYTEHNMLERYHRLTRAASLATWGLQKRVIAVSEEVARSISSHAGDKIPVARVRNGVDTRRFSRDSQIRESKRQELGYSDRTVVFGTCAVFREQKRLDRWLAVARYLVDEGVDARFLLVGDGPLRDEVEDRSRELKLGDRLIMPGLQADVRPYLSAMDVFMMSSVFEGLPVALLEAMAMELPVVATKVGGIPEVVVDGENGYLVEADDIVALGEAAKNLATSPSRRMVFGEQSRTRIEAEFSVDRMVGELEAIYDEVRRV
jgi:glycosyltransferase involved in cell wall biosynthesis